MTQRRLDQAVNNVVGRYLTRQPPPSTKTYFMTRDYNTAWPQEFVESRNPRYVYFQYCRVTCNGYLDAETEVHASFIPRDEYCDSLVWYANLLPPDDNRQYKYNLNNDGFAVWFTDGSGHTIVPDNFCLFLKLEY